jgi:hypothetical protein
VVAAAGAQDEPARIGLQALDDDGTRLLDAVDATRVPEKLAKCGRCRV